MEIAALPDDALADVLRCLPAQSLAAARCVCKAWRAVVDARALLLPHLLPHQVCGVFINYIDHDRPHLFARPCSTSSLTIDGMLSFMPNDHWRDWWSVQDHCNGLLLCDIEWERDLCVCNPATRQCAVLPRRTEDTRYTGAYLAFDPAVSPHYEVFLIPNVPEKPPAPKVDEKHRALLRQQELEAPFCLDWLFSLPDNTLIAEDEEEELQQVPSVDEENEPDDDPCRLMEWPPSSWTFNVFSSRTGQWENRTFFREGEPMGTIENIRLDPSEPTCRGPRRRYAMYWQGALYVHCRGAFVTRLPLSNDKYQVIKTPPNIGKAKPYLGKSEKGVTFGIVDGCKLQVWILSESSKQMGWTLKYEDDLKQYAQHVATLPYDNGRLVDGSWNVEEDIDVHDSGGDAVESLLTKNLEEENIDVHDSDDDNVESLLTHNLEEHIDVDDCDDDDVESLLTKKSEWDSDNDDLFTVDVEDEVFFIENFDILGFHPYKEVIFLVEPFAALAYHLNSSKVQYLGNSRPKSYYRNYTNGIYESFVYTPCMIGVRHGDSCVQSSS
ncbi:hypothetical protein ACP70R_012131 [Stipagrostis hirtigluma subsp. patula]